MDKQHIIDEIHRTAKDGKALGQMRFTTATGIKENEWRGKYWARWGDALIEAGFSQNEWNAAHDKPHLLQSLLLLTRKYGKFPTPAEVRLERRSNPELPSYDSIIRLGNKVELIKELLSYCITNEGYADVEKILKATPSNRNTRGSSEESNSLSGGYVYLVSAQSAYKIGCTRAPYRRVAEIANQSAEGATLEHLISTDDPEGIEKYWHNRFADKRIVGANKQSGEWFRLSKDDVRAFRRRKNFM